MRITIRFGKKDKDIADKIKEIEEGERSSAIKSMIRFFYSVSNSNNKDRNNCIDKHVNCISGSSENNSGEQASSNTVRDTSIDELLDQF